MLIGKGVRNMIYLRSSLLVGLVLLMAGAPLLAEDEEPTANEKASAFCKAFKRVYKKRTAAQLTDDVDTIVGFMKDPAVDEKGPKKALVGAMEKVAMSKDTSVRTYLVKKCSGLDESVAKLVIKILMKELAARIPEEDVYEAAFETLGNLKSERPEVTKVLIDLLKNKENSIVAQSCYAISLYGGASGKVRKKFFEEVLKQSEGTYNSSQGNDDNAKRRWTIIGDDVMEALNNLSLPPRTIANFSNPARARSWYNKNKKKPWKAAE
jgi:hypothetical protein